MGTAHLLQNADSIRASDMLTVFFSERRELETMSTCRFLLSNGVISQASDAPTVTSFLETHPERDEIELVETLWSTISSELEVPGSSAKVLSAVIGRNCIFILESSAIGSACARLCTRYLLIMCIVKIVSGAYTTTRTHNNGSCILFWGRHLNRLINSAKILLNLNPQLLFGSSWPADASSVSSMALSVWEVGIRDLVDDSMRKVLPRAMSDREMGQELAIMVLLGGNLESSRKSMHVDQKRGDCVLDVHVHVSAYVPPVFGAGQSGARLALVGRGRSVAAAKYSDWVRLRKPLERLRPPSVTELLLSDDGDHILEGTITNFFVICRKDIGEDNGKGVHPGLNIYSSFEVQTAPVRDGVLPGVLRQLVIEVCLSKGIPFQEVAPSWSMHELWEEAFVTNGLRLLQHVDTILVPSEHASLESRNYKEVSWKEKQFQDGPGMITRMIQKEIVEKAMLEGHLLDSS